MKLCPTCQPIRAQWLRLDYDPRHPSEWPGQQQILDARTSHTERRADWQRKTDRIVTDIENRCAQQHLADRLLQVAA
jgi:hypothetical protein